MILIWWNIVISIVLFNYHCLVLKILRVSFTFEYQNVDLWGLWGEGGVQTHLVHPLWLRAWSPSNTRNAKSLRILLVDAVLRLKY